MHSDLHLAAGHLRDFLSEDFGVLHMEIAGRPGERQIPSRLSCCRQATRGHGQAAGDAARDDTFLEHGNLPCW